MSQKKADDKETNIFILNSLYPEADAVFSFKPQPLEDIKDSCLIVLDTNVLLIPFDTGKESLEQIKSTYKSLIKTEQLVVPGRVAREFAKNRSEKLKTIYQRISRKRDLSISRQVYPLLESSEEYQKLIDMEKEIDSKLSDYRKQVSSLLDKISGWYWDDPVSSLYRELFSQNIVFDVEYDEEKIQSELEYRQLHSIPPGFQDSTKEDRGIGDLLIWNTILELGKSRNKDTIFVTNDNKNDWWHKSEKQALYPRFELVEEYRHNSGGRTIHIINFSKFLGLFGASPEVVNEVRREEFLSSIHESENSNTNIDFAIQAQSAVEEWILAMYPESTIIFNNGGFPDFIVQNTEFQRLGIDVFTYQGGPKSFYRSMKRILRRAKEDLIRDPLDRLIIIFVVSNKNAASIIEMFYRFVDYIGSTGEDILLLMGILSVDGKFVELHNFNFSKD
ncbi:MAG: PIN domain-containing protein [Cyanobacteria bacterium P01_H01_bin.15]